MFLAIVDSDSNGKLKKHQPYEFEDDADAHVLKYGGFVILDPGGNKEFWIIDPVAKTIKIDYSGEALQKLSNDRNRLYNNANIEYIKRSLIAAENVTNGISKIRGGNSKDHLNNIYLKSNTMGSMVLRTALIKVYDNLNDLKDIIETSDQSILDNINITDDINWN
jgi:hypothetical protein